MANEETIINKQIDLDTIIELACYLEEQKNEYIKLIKEDENKNKGLPYNEQVYKYKCFVEPKVQYGITFKDNKEIQQSDYNWFVENLSNASMIKRISMFLNVSYSDNSINRENNIHRNISESIFLDENGVYLRVDGNELEDEVYKQHSYIRGLLESGENRFNKTIKNRKIRIQSFCLSIGIVLSYIIFLVLTKIRIDLPEIVVQILNNKYVIIFGQWIVSAIIGNIFGHAIIMGLYKEIIPKTKFSHYSSSAREFVYVDDIDSYVSECEVHIGKYANSKKNRSLIEKIYKITSKIVLIQLTISVGLFFILK